MAYPSEPSLDALRPLKFDTKTQGQRCQHERLDAF